MNQAKHAVNIIRVGDEWMHYHARHNFSFPASQLGLSSCLSTCLPDYLPTYRAPFVQIKGTWMGARWNIISFHKNSFWKGDVLSFFTLCASKPHCLPPPCKLSSLFLLLSLAGCLPLYLKYPSYLYVHCPMPPNPWMSASTGYLHHCLSVGHFFQPFNFPNCFFLSPKNCIHVQLICINKCVL